MMLHSHFIVMLLTNTCQLHVHHIFIWNVQVYSYRNGNKIQVPQICTVVSVAVISIATARRRCTLRDEDWRQPEHESETGTSLCCSEEKQSVAAVLPALLTLQDGGRFHLSTCLTWNQGPGSFSTRCTSTFIWYFITAVAVFQRNT